MKSTPTRLESPLEIPAEAADVLGDPSATGDAPQSAAGVPWLLLGLWMCSRAAVLWCGCAAVGSAVG